MVTAIALNVFPGRSFLDRVRTAAVRTRHLIWPSLFTEILQTILLIRQKDFVDALSADHLETSYELRSQKKYSSLQMSDYYRSSVEVSTQDFLEPVVGVESQAEEVQIAL